MDFEKPAETGLFTWASSSLRLRLRCSSHEGSFFVKFLMPANTRWLFASFTDRARPRPEFAPVTTATGSAIATPDATRKGGDGLLGCFWKSWFGKGLKGVLLATAGLPNSSLGFKAPEIQRDCLADFSSYALARRVNQWHLIRSFHIGQTPSWPLHVF